VVVAIRPESAPDPLANGVRFEVRDSGIGIPADKLAKLFQPFSQVDASTTRKYGGSGLGLSISKKLTELMHGEMGVESQPEQGSTFWFRLPLEACSLQSRPHETGSGLFPLNDEANAGADAFAGARILLAEDNLINQDVAVSILRKKHIRVNAVGNGLEAIHALEQQDYQLVLMDMQMPEMDGLQATRVIRDRSSQVLNHQIPIIAMTANAMQRDQDACLQAGMNDYLSKPYTPADLLRKLAAWLSPGDRAGLVEPLGLPEPAEPGPAAALEEAPKLQTIDFDALYNRVMQDRELAIALLQKASANLEHDLGEIQSAIQRQDGEKIRQSAHRLKGAAGNLSALELHQVCKQLEAAGAAAEWDALPGLWEELETRAFAFRQAVDQMEV
jgi:CheY-like chemotaxis protein